MQLTGSKNGGVTLGGGAQSCEFGPNFHSHSHPLLDYFDYFDYLEKFAPQLEVAFGYADIAKPFGHKAFL